MAEDPGESEFGIPEFSNTRNQDIISPETPRINQDRPSVGQVSRDRALSEFCSSGIGVSGFQGYETLTLQNLDMRYPGSITSR